MNKVKVGQRVKCIEAPRSGEYKCKVGDIFTIKSLVIGSSTPCFYSVESIERYTSPCFRNKLFKRVGETYLGGE